MNHVEMHLPDYVQGTLEEDVRRMVEAHLAVCAACRGEMQAVREGLAALARSEAVSPPDGYFATVVPRLRMRLEDGRTPTFFGHPLVVRFGLPLLAGAIALTLLLHVPFGPNETSVASNPLKPVFRDLSADQFVEAILEQSPQLSPIAPSSEGEMSALLAVPFLGDSRIGLIEDSDSITVEPVLGTVTPEYLNQLSEADIDNLVAQLSERTLL